MLREWEEPRVGGASRRERELRKEAKHPSRSRREAPPTRPRGGCRKGRFRGYPRYGPGRDRRSWGDSRGRFGFRYPDGTESAVLELVALQGGHCQLEIVESTVSGVVCDSERAEVFGSDLVSRREGPSG